MASRILTDDHLEAFLEWLKLEEKSSATCEKYARDIRRFMEYTADESVSKEVVARWKNDLMEKGYAVRSINSMLASLNSLLAFLGWEDCKVKNIRLQHQTFSSEEEELSRAEYQRLLQASKVFPHNLRKLFARTFYGIGKDIAQLADVRGHSSINTTRIYIMTSGAEHRQNVERLGLVMGEKWRQKNKVT